MTKLNLKLKLNIKTKLNLGKHRHYGAGGRVNIVVREKRNLD